MPFYFFHLYRAFDEGVPVVAVVLRRLRVAADLSQEELARRAGLHRNFVGLVERGARNPTFNTITALLAVLETSWEEFGRQIDQVYRQRGRPIAERDVGKTEPASVDDSLEISSANSRDDAE